MILLMAGACGCWTSSWQSTAEHAASLRRTTFQGRMASDERVLLLPHHKTIGDGLYAIINEKRKSML